MAEDEKILRLFILEDVMLEIINGSAVFISGLAELEAVTSLVQDDSWQPLKSESGQTWAGVWLIDAAESSLGAFQLAQVVFFGAEKDLAPLPTRPLALFHSLSFDPASKMLAHGTWVDSPAVQETSAGSAKLMHGRFQPADNCWNVGYSETESQEILMTGRLVRSAQQEPRMTVEMARTFGLGGWLKMLTRKKHHIRTAASQISYSADKTVVRYFNSRSDSLIIQQLDYDDIAFRPGLVQEMEGIQMRVGVRN